MYDFRDSCMSEIAVKEESLFNNAVRGNADDLVKILSENSISIDENGETKFIQGQCLELLDGVLYISDDTAKMTRLAENIVLFTYEAVKVKKDKRTKANCSSLWKKENELWKMVFHQRTIISEGKK
jgi:hypothetical protein